MDPSVSGIFFLLHIIKFSDVSIPRVGSGRSGNRPSGRVGYGSGIAL